MARLDSLFHEMQDRGASDLHIVVGRPPMIRTRGDLVETEHERLTASKAEELIVEILTPAQHEQVGQHLDLDFAYELPGLARFRANVMHQHRGLGAVFRIIPTDIMTLDQLGMPPAVRKLAEMPAGLILVTGPTGSGKSTTLAGMIDHINETREAHILTIEDPLEFIHQPKKCLITQREVGAHTENFASALRVAGRQDPDIILVGEMRDLETISLALTSAACGLLVFGTLHTNSAIKTVDRIIDAYPPEEQNQVRAMLADSLSGVVAQQLVKTTDNKRCAAVEILIGGRALGNIIREGKTSMIPSYMQSGSGEGMQTMDQALVALVQAGRITAEDAMTKATDKTVFERLVAGGPGAAIGGIPPIGGPPPGAVPRPGPPPGATPRQPGQSGFPPPQRPPIGRR
ncbi:MAG: type IV pilus twitching motility protein PilT [Blastocatellia bacterium]|jgi:twitching motility protein PilT|nr:type IV pilus twitching motility protein PilT [Blastocatellia bacterium]MBK6426860.1 type IV pilus twitching motility protein PilT [Blastocatellia bacterium]